MIYKPIKTSQGLQAFSTYTGSSRSSVVWGTGNVTDLNTTINLEVLIEYPTNIPAGTAVPLIVCPSAGGFTLVNPIVPMDAYTSFVTAGAVLMSPRYRVTTDSPVSSHDVSGDSDMTKGVRGGTSDFRRFMELVRQYPERITGNFKIDPRRIFSMGYSSGGQQGIRFASIFPTHLCGLIVISGAVGLGEATQNTTDLRAFFTENSLTPNTPPGLFLGSSSDSVIGATWTGNLSTVLNADSVSTVLLQPGTNHYDLVDLSNVTYSGNVVSAFECCRRWMNDQMTGLSARMPSKVTFS